MPFRVNLSKAEELFERDVRVRYIEILTFWKDTGKYDRDTLWELWDLTIRAIYVETGGDAEKITPQMMSSITFDVERRVAPSFNLPQRPKSSRN